MLARRPNLSTPARPPVAPSCGFLSNMAPARSARLEPYKASYHIRVSYLAGARRPAIHHRSRRCSAAKSCRSRIIVHAYLSIFRAGAFMAISLNRFSAMFALIPMQSSDPFLHVLRCLQISVFQQVPTLHNRFMTLYHNNNNYYYYYYSAPSRCAKYCDERVCMSVRSHISKTACPNFTKVSVHVNCGRESVFF